MGKDNERSIDIAKNIKLIEWLKSEMLTSLAELFRLLTNGIKGTQNAIVDCLANIIIVCYLLGKRLGIQFSSIDKNREKKIKLGIVEEHDVERYYGDLSALTAHIQQTRD